MKIELEEGRHAARHAETPRSDVRVGASASRSSVGGSSAAATALFVRLREPLSEALTRPRIVARVPPPLVVGAAGDPPSRAPWGPRRDAALASQREPPAFPRRSRGPSPAPELPSIAPALSPQAAAHVAPRGSRASGAPPSGFHEPSETLFRVATRSRAVRFLAVPPGASVATRAAMIVSALLLVVALCLLSVLAA